MAHYVASIECAVSPEAAFHYLADFSNAADWDPTVTRVESEGVGLGARFRVFLGVVGFETALDYETTRFERGRCVEFRAETPLLRSLDVIEVHPTTRGCRVDYDADLRLLGAAKWVDLPTHWAFQVSGRRSLAGLEQALAELD